MNRGETLAYIQENFSIGGEAKRLIDNILQYAEKIEDRTGRYVCLRELLAGTIGLSDIEIRRFLKEEPYGT